jgi:Spy/CpxP family protein refolding chaperone
METNKVTWMVAVALGTMIALSPALRAEDKPNKPERPGPGQGPGAGPRGEAMKERMAKISEELKLTEEQKTKVRDAMKEQAEKARELRDLEPEARREKMKEARGEMQAKMKEILTAEQYTKWEKLREEMRPKGDGQNGPAKRKGPKGEKPEKN